MTDRMNTATTKGIIDGMNAVTANMWSVSHG
jgi:hypothetical protein